MGNKLVDRGRKLGRILTSPVRIMPSFLIIGAKKCGTTSLFKYLIEHPNVGTPIKKEISFFDVNFRKGISWYKSYFPTVEQKLYKPCFITGEATANYIDNPDVPSRVAETIPNVKLIALLRNPVDRAYSHYYHTKRIGREFLSFEEAIEQEEERVKNIRSGILQDKYGNFYHQDYNYTYLSSGIYIEQLQAWFNLFSKKQILVLTSEDFFAKPAAIFQQVLDFLGLPSCELKQYKKYNYNRYANKIDPTTRQYLIEYFQPHNNKLYQLLDKKLNWDK